MKKKRIIFAALLAMLPFEANADLIEITGTISSDGIWDISVTEGRYDELLSDLMDQEWWSDTSGDLALAFAEETYDLFGFPNAGFPLGPYFAFDPTDSQYPVAVAACEAGRCDFFNWGGGGTWYWATATRVPPTPTGLMDYTMTFYFDGLANGTILGVGTGRRAEKKIDKFEVLFFSADAAIDSADDAVACEELDDAYYRIDGLARPNDYLVGPAVPTLSTLIQLVMESLACPQAYEADRCPSSMRTSPPVDAPPSAAAACGKR
jgi:hypothetical protein